MKNKKQSIVILRNSARYILLTFCLLVFFFALFSGAGESEGFRGIIKNSPNALPWAILLAFVFVAWKWELVGGILITLFGFGALYFFGFSGDKIFAAALIISFIPIVLGALFILVFALQHKSDKKTRLQE